MNTFGRSEYWLGVVSPQNWKVVRGEEVWGVPESVNSIKRMKEGNLLVIYVKGRGIGGIFSIDSGLMKENVDRFKGGDYPKRVRIEPKIIPDNFLDLKLLVEELEFIKNKKNWGAYLQTPIRAISKKDYELIEEKTREL